MAKEKQKMSLGVRRRHLTVPTAIDPAKLEAFAAGADNAENPKPAKPTEQRVVRDAFTMPLEDHLLFAEVQRRCLSMGLITTKSEIVRAGLKLFVDFDDVRLKEVIKNVPKLKIGRPAAGKIK